MPDVNKCEDCGTTTRRLYLYSDAALCRDCCVRREQEAYNQEIAVDA